MWKLRGESSEGAAEEVVDKQRQAAGSAGGLVRGRYHQLPPCTAAARAPATVPNPSTSAQAATTLPSMQMIHFLLETEDPFPV